jgi:hypothetical protein
LASVGAGQVVCPVFFFLSFLIFPCSVLAYGSKNHIATVNPNNLHRALVTGYDLFVVGI